MTKEVSRFETVLKVKKHQEKVTQQQLMQIQDAHQREKETLETLHSKREEAVKDTPSFGKAKVTDLQTQRAFIFKLSRQIHHQSSKVDEIREKEEGKRQELTERAQSRQMVEKLDDKKKAEAAREIEHKEQKLIDDIASRTSKVAKRV